ncbi:MAG: small multi-drug export protein [Clostridia bacterium]|nr:small multi-drug export protein [Clostridia bacterium]
MTALISMVPVIELRGAIPVAIANGLDFQTAVIISIIGNLLPVPIIILFVRKVFKWMQDHSEKLAKFVAKMEAKADAKKDRVLKYEFWGLVILVAIPLPGTGAWTGALVAAMLDMQMKRAFPAIALGVLIAAAIVSYVTYGVTLIV